LLAVETLMPVCSPSRKQQFAALSGNDPLSHSPLIHVTSVSTDWNHWFETSGMELPSPIGGLRVDTVAMAFDAAIRGLGVALGRRPLVDDDIESGRLVPLIDRTLPSGSGYWLITPHADFQKPEVKQFRRWLLTELGVGSDQRKAARSGSRKVQSFGR
jgi:LysR family transcriptional regulator, glycine cleavage system transcriptional activator